MQTRREIKVVIADDHEIFRDGLKLMLSHAADISCIGEAADGNELISIVDKLKPDVVITDIKMPGLDGIEAAKQITALHPEIGIIGLSMFEEEQLIMDMLEAGASGYLLKNSDKEELIDAIHTVAKNGQYYCKHTSAKLAKMIAHSRHTKNSEKDKAPEFTEKEVQIIKLICEGMTNKEIGEKLFMSVRTIEGYRIKILEKMNVKNTVGIVITAIKLGYYSPELV